MLLNHSETDRKKGAVRGRESRNHTELSPTEFAAVEVVAATDGCALRGSASDPSLAEIHGVHLLLVNVLRPLAAGRRLTPEAFDKLLDEISDAKHQRASKLVSPLGRE